MEAANFQQTQSGRTARKTEKIQKPEPSQTDSRQRGFNHHLHINCFYLVHLPASDDHYKNWNCTCYSGYGHLSSGL